MARPLDKIVEGVRLTRDAAIEAAIDVALGQTPVTWRARAAITDRKAPDYLPSECLVHLIRNAMRQSNAEATHNSVANALLPFLLKRCEANLKAKVSSQIATAEDLRADILAAFAVLFAEDLAPDADRKLDFYEVKFNRAFRFFRIDAVRAELRRINRIDGGPTGSSDDGSPDAEADVALGSAANIAAPDTDPLEGIFRQQMRPKLLAAIKALPDDERKAFILRYHYELKIESQDPNETTVATLCKVSGRTISDRLKRAKAKLAEILKEAT
jgi:hypothetical protein